MGDDCHCTAMSWIIKTSTISINKDLVIIVFLIIYQQAINVIL